ncbi:ubiquitin carboxyl-terminal hydrolase 19-like isoform X3 [Myxocyprinus asiaticus]|uniref:ubiquitin carboxyl-terminal hydrolase 19-like isoform X3 n=1 Tax=Myxocyprinus asiaticus TaxID=70543 RepID=UPI0022214B20|nr:ubiquitin carboxyl-terminal hydrolase 19-like isoform X3 [Myxocyprinus asiaticus]
MASSSTGPSETGRRRGQRAPDDTASTSKKKQKDRAKQESKEAKRAASVTNTETRKDLFLDWKQSAYEVIVRLNCGDGVQRVEDIDSAFSDTACHIRMPDGREWSCHLHEEIEASCSKLLYKEKANVMQLVMHKKIPLNTWPTLANKKETEPVNILKENDSNLQQSTTGQSEKSAETIEMQKTSTLNSAEQKRGKPDRGLKRGMKGKQMEHTYSSVTKAAELKSGDKADLNNEPSAKRTTQPSRNTKEPTQAPSSAREPQSKPAVNGKPNASASSSAVSSSSNSKDSRAQLLVKGQACQTSQKVKELDSRPTSHSQVEVDESKILSQFCNPKVAQQENSSSLMREHTSGDACAERIASEERENRKEVKKPEAAAQVPKMLPPHNLGSGEPISTTASKREDFPQKSCTEEKRDKSKEEPHGGNQEEDTEGPEPMVNLKLVKNDSYEKGTDLMVVNIYVKEICRETSRVLFREQDFTLIFQTSDPNFLRLHPDCGPNTVFKWQVKLRNLIQPDQSSYAFTPSRIDINLKKRHSQRWGGLEAPATQVGGAKVAVPSSPTLHKKSQPGSSQHALPAKEEPRVGEEKAKPPRAPEDTGLDAVAPHSVPDHMPLKQEPTVATPKPTCMVQPMTHTPPACSERTEEVEEKKVCLPGFTGLVNLGNTCFMNSVIQSLSNTRELRDYFHDRAFESEINCNNPLGTGGRLAIGFAVLLRALWKGTYHAFQPSKLKAIVASKASQFTGYAQHDAQEFMAFLLDGLHEDLNRIQNKPYTETVDSDGRQDEVVAEEAWQRHKMRNDSFIVDLFLGQYKSKLVCPVCSKVSITFDPFLYLPVPLPQKQKVLTVFYFTKECHKKPIKFLVSVSKENSSTAEVLESISCSVRIKPENLRLAEVGKGRFQRIFSPSHSLDTVTSSDLLFCFEVLSKDLAKERVVLLKVQQRPQVPSMPITKCAGCMKPPASEEEKLKRCTRCYRVGYCNQACQRNHWPTHKTLCRTNVENIGLPFLISVPESRLTYTRLTQLLEEYSRYSVDVFQPPFQSGRTSPEASLTRVDLSSMASSVSECQERKEKLSFVGETENLVEQGDSLTTPQTETLSALSRTDGDTLSTQTSDSGFCELAASSQDSLVEKETSCEKTVKPEAVVTGFQQPSESGSGSASQFYISVLDSNQKEDKKLEDKGDAVLELPDDSTLELVWKNNERLKEYVLVRTKELEFDEDSGSATETARAGHFTLEQCLNLFTKPEVLAPEEAWYCPKCQQHREASKQLLLWRLPNVLIIQLKRFSFRSFIWRDKINDMVDFPVRNLNLSKFCIGHKEDIQQPPIYDLYAVINHYGGMIGGHYTAYARLPSDKNSQRSDVGWRLFDDSTVTTVEESQVVTRYAYVLFYRRRNSPVERLSRLGPIGAECSSATGGAASQASLIWQELEEDEEGQREASFLSLFRPSLRGRKAKTRLEEEAAGRGGLAHRRQDGISNYSDNDRLRYFILGTTTAFVALLFNLIYPLLCRSKWG